MNVEGPPKHRSTTVTCTYRLQAEPQGHAAASSENTTNSTNFLSCAASPKRFFGPWGGEAFLRSLRENFYGDERDNDE
jgi:hypothetical protein